MRILALAHGLWFGGAQISTLEFLEGLKGKLDLKLLVCSEADENFTSNATIMGMGVYHVPCRISSGYPIMDVSSAKDLIKWADIAWITDVEYLSAPLIKQTSNIPVIAHLRSYALICPWWWALFGFREPCLERCSARRITKCKQGINLELAKIGLLSDVRARLYWLLDFAKAPLDYYEWSKIVDGAVEFIDGFIAVSKALWNIHVSHIPSLSNYPFNIVYNPITEPLRHVKPAYHEPYGGYIFYASGSNPDKGPHLLLEAWPIISKEFNDLKLYIVGCKNSWVERMAKKMNLKNIVFFEKLPSDKYYNVMYRARAVVMPSIWPEPFGRIPVEANRLGVPAVVSSAGGLPETIVDGVTGYIFKAGDVDDLVEKIVRVLEKNFDREEIIRHSYEKINPQREMEKLIKFFENVIDYGGRV
ncbi:MAG: glycosyltransferase [Fervidicoccaceae archaeon]|nr:glycosyltransferase [Fervidicoccaceae archaeon]